MRLEDDSARMLAEKGFTVCCSTGDHGILATMWEMSQAWKKKEEGGVTTSLRVTLFLVMLHLAQKRLVEIVTQAEVKANAIKHSASRRTTCGIPEKEGESVVSEKPGPAHSKVLIALGTLKKIMPMEGVLTRFHSRRPLSSNHSSPVLPFLLSVGLRAHEANLAYDVMRSLIGCSALKAVG